MLLRMWGMIRGHDPLTDETMDAALRELEQAWHSRDMNHKPHITVDIPDEKDFEEAPSRIPVSYLVVSSTIDTLQGILTQWKREADYTTDEDEQVWSTLITAAGHALGALVAAYAANVSVGSVGQLVEEIGWALELVNIRTALKAVRTADNAFIVDALLALEEEAKRRYNEQHRQLPTTGAAQPAQCAPPVEAREAVRGERQNMRKEQEQQPPSEQGSIADRDPGWEF